MTEKTEKYLEVVKKEVSEFIDSIDIASYENAAEIIWGAIFKGGRVHITGIGKPAHIAQYAASLFSSTGTPTYFLHGTEAVHGSCGQLTPNDVVICISNSGETEEMKVTARAIRNYGCKIIGITGNEASWLSRFSDVHIFAGVDKEGGPLNRAPRASIIAETIALQTLSVILQEKTNITPEQYVLRHPGGTLGKLRDNER